MRKEARQNTPIIEHNLFGRQLTDPMLNLKTYTTLLHLETAGEKAGQFTATFIAMIKCVVLHVDLFGISPRTRCLVIN